VNKRNSIRALKIRGANKLYRPWTNFTLRQVSSRYPEDRTVGVIAE
jgi:hypothetical protein